MDIDKWSPTFFLENKANCLNYIKENYYSAPYLNVNNSEYIPNNSLVRFRGMVQDMYDPEYYLEKCEIINTVTGDRCIRSGKYKDTIYCNDDEVPDIEHTNNVSSERQTFVVISIPGLNSWVNMIERQKYKKEFENEKATTSTKRPLDTTNEIDVPMEINTIENKKICRDTTAETSKSVLSKEHFLNFPIREETGKTCHIKVYENNNNIKLNEVYDFIGFLSCDAIQMENENDFNTEIEIQTHNPPSSLIARIHCICWTKVECSNPLVEDISINTDKLQFLKKELHLVLTEIMMGDELAAHYLLYHLLSRVYLRRDLMPLGTFTLNISNIPTSAIKDYGRKLYSFLEMLVYKSHYLPMTLENMNNLIFTPKKDYNCNRLTSGLLQLSKETHLVLDETKLSSGKLNEAGVKAVSAINSVIKNQKLAYDFSYYNMEFECDIPILVISEGKSLLPSDSHVVLKPSGIHVRTFDEICDAVMKLLNPTLLNDLRVYLTISRSQQYEISDNMLEIVQQDFVNMRQRDKISADDLHHLLVLSRLVCIAEGKLTLDEECWRITCDLEDTRKARL